MTKLEKELMNMTPAARKKAVESISNQMGANPKERKTASTAKKSTTKKK